METIDSTLQENRRLRALLDTFALLNSSLELDTVLKTTLSTACDLMSASIASIALINNDQTELEFLESTDPNFDKLKKLSVPLGQGVAGTVAITGKTERIEDIHNDPRFYEKIDRALGQTTSSYLCTPLIVEDKIIGTLQIMNRLAASPTPETNGGPNGLTFTADDEPLIEGFARQAALAIQNAKLHEFQLQQRAFDLEMAVCAEIQSNLFPRAVPEVPGFELYGASVPAQQVGGDYYSFVRRPDGTCDVVLADVSGKGLPAALIVSDFHTGYQLLVQLDDPIQVSFNKLNAHLTDSMVTGKYARTENSKNSRARGRCWDCSTYRFRKAKSKCFPATSCSRSPTASAKCTTGATSCTVKTAWRNSYVSFAKNLSQLSMND